MRDEALSATLSARARAFGEAVAAMQSVKDFVGSPENILGNAETKHGEIAEQCHVGFRRAIDFLYERTATATFEGVDRTGPVDYIDGVDIQSKYYNGLRNTLGGVEAHAERYTEFVTDGGRYHIPKDQFDELQQLRETGAIDGFSARSTERLQGRFESLEQHTSRSIDDLVEPGETSYAEVQQGRVHETIEDREEDLVAKDDELRRQAQMEHGPSLSGAATAAAMGGAAGAGVGFAQAVWLKYREGKNPFQGDFGAADWKDVGLQAAKGGAGGALAGGSVYLLTNATDLAAPFAGSLVSGLMGIGDLIGQYQAGQINADEFVDLSLMVTSESAIVGIAAAAGQTLIPVPMLGAFIGSVAGKFVASAVRECLEGDASELVARLEAYAAEAIARLDDSLRQAVENLDAYYGRLGDLTKLAFDQGVNVELRLRASIEVAEVLGVRDEDIVRTSADVDSFMVGSS